jgi:DMSO/TMAO reductase YedYZ molybdopterin-dependent catalytic subunit
VRVKLDRRSFIKLISAVAVAVAGGSVLFLRQPPTEPVATSQVTTMTGATSVTTPVTTSTSSITEPATSSEGFAFPVTWNGDGTTVVDSDDYRLRIDGDVPKPLELTLADLHAMPTVQKTLLIRCVEGWEAEVPWEGIQLSYLVTQAGGSLRNLDHLTVVSVTGYSRDLGPDEITDSDTLIALKAGGAPLSAEHGYPARLVVPAKPGLDWVKYATRIKCVNK